MSRDKTARLWDVVTGEHLVTLRGHRGGVAGCAFTPSGKTLITSGCDGMIRFWPTDFAEIARLTREPSVR